jgi:transposase
VTSAKAITEVEQMKEMSRVEQFERIRRDHRDEGLSVRALADRHKVHRRTVRQALADAVPPPRKAPVRVAPVLGPHIETVRGWLVADLDAPRKQRHTARRVWQRLVEEEGVTVAESSVRPLVAELRAEVGLVRRDVAVPQTHLAGQEAEVDFGEFRAVIAGEEVRLWMFVLRLSHSGAAVHLAYSNQASESFLDGHVAAFARLGGVPTGKIRYDNLKVAVVKVLLGRQRLEHPRFVGLRSHYGFDSFYCEPGLAGAHEKGGVEGDIGRFRRRHLTPMPHVPSLAVLNVALAAADARDDARRIAARVETVGQAAARERPLLAPLPTTTFDAATALSCRVDAKARICVRQSYYSVPARLAGRRVDVALGATAIVVRHEGKVVAEHVRSLHKGTEDLQLDHYLEVLARRPGALAGATPLLAARAAGSFTPTHQRFWDAARRSLGDAAGTRALVGVLLLHRTLPAPALQAGLDAALRLGSTSPDLVAVEARRHLEPQRPGAPPPLGAAATGGAGAAGDGLRPVPTLLGYDALLDGVPA